MFVSWRNNYISTVNLCISNNGMKILYKWCFELPINIIKFSLIFHIFHSNAMHISIVESTRVARAIMVTLMLLILQKKYLNIKCTCLEHIDMCVWFSQVCGPAKCRQMLTTRGWRASQMVALLKKGRGAACHMLTLADKEGSGGPDPFIYGWLRSVYEYEYGKILGNVWFKLWIAYYIFARSVLYSSMGETSSIL